MKLREYQEEIINKTKDSLRRGNKKVVIFLPTGGGKSACVHEIVKMASIKNNNVLVLAHRTLLIEQLTHTLSKFNNVVIETLQSSKNREHDDIKIIVVDEFHYAVNSQMQDKVLSKYKNAIIIGLSATPITAQGNKIEGVDEIVEVVQFKDLVDMGFLSPLKVLATANVDKSSFKTSMGDYNGKDVAEEVTKSSIVENVVEQYVKYADGMRAIVFCINIDHAELLASEFELSGYRTSPYHSKMNNRQEVLSDFKRGELDILTSVESLTTGFDAPDVYCGVFATPTKSIIKAIQCYGRIARLDPKNPFKEGLILDCAGVIDDTQHPYQNIVFSKEKGDNPHACACGGSMIAINKKITAPNENGAYFVTTTYKCNKCYAVEVKKVEKIDELNFCESCSNIIEKGTGKTVTKEEKDSIIIYSICPHCENEKIFREVETIKDAVMEERLLNVYIDEVETWEEIEEELGKARDRYGKKYHHVWKTKAVKCFKENGFDIKEVKQSIKYYTKEGWSLGGLCSAMQKRRDKMV